MDPVITKARDLLKGRLAEVNDEQKRLEKALSSLNGSAPRRGRPAGKTASKRTRKGGTRADQALQLIKDKPGITASDIATTMRIKPNYLYRVLSDLEKQKLVTKKGRTYTAK